MKTTLKNWVGKIFVYPNDILVLLGYIGLVIATFYLFHSLAVASMVFSIGIFVLGIAGKRKEENR